MTFAAGLVAAMAILTGVEATRQTVCEAPVAPAVERPVKPTRPPAPSCIDEARNRHSCSNRVINAYNAELERYGQAFDAYVADVNGYIRKLGEYIEAVNAYSQCEQRVVMPSPVIQG